jgi:hypothetical protein
MRRWHVLFDVLVLMSILCGVSPSLAATTVTITLTNYPEEVVIVDVNGDGNRDIVALADDPENSESWQIVTIRASARFRV